jgi:hypothetical protein
MKTEENKIHWQILAFPTGIRFLLNPENITNEEEIFDFLKGIKDDEKEKIRGVLNELKKSKEKQVEKIIELSGIELKFYYENINLPTNGI